ncbi:ribosome-associated translation inhibitor RaiA [Agrococcus sediminis]|jgi:ribosomal subunit interface protein|uniref:Ribosome hibernation promoting factor n=1 Tax=Agrococcus sediminis TaxID=2599924 RepID=A0A5M8QAP5_9MICO|nr:MULTISPECIES: ribosome-associated translation inhibitor RaiA [Agrococcus]KAA6432024.1 ribosome-associated translation inhibitor RaiA [Agrococcus sediminis]MDR7233109.1 ribosomal subunit interface protein [Agrococcus sp. BE272]RWR16927.1 ribosome-associated translation inhibitor RaiA [Agrococcus lahaulensis]UOV99923.1 ribosome-associated translation inhibitor RaiA [Agrococcus sp. SCSIO52902]
MEITFGAKGADITDRFRAYAEEKLAKVTQLLPRATALDVKLTRHADAHSAIAGGRVEITVHGPGSIIRAESDGPDKYMAFDSAYHRIMERARRAHDKRHDHSARKRTPLREAAANGFEQVAITPADPAVVEAVATGSVPTIEPDREQEHEWSPVVIREKRFPAKRMGVREAVDQMELVGHPFYLFVDEASGECAVVYRRKGWSYGVISLDEEQAESAASAERAAS